jgi:hypothetical protein
VIEEPEVIPEPQPTPVEPQPAPANPPAPSPEQSRKGESPSEEFTDLKTTLQTQKEQIAKMQLMLDEFTRKTQNQTSKQTQTTQPAQPAQTTQPNPLDAVDDQAIIEKPKESVLKLINGVLQVVLPAAFTEYDLAVARRASNKEIVDAFRKTKPDFDELRPIMRQIVIENPTLNDDPEALPRIYEEAKQRKSAYLESLKKELNIPAPVPTPTTQPAPAVSEEEMLAKLEQRIVDKIRKRRAAQSGTASPTSQPVLPPQRMTTTPKEVQKSETDLMFEAMLKAGVPSSGFLKDIETTRK